MKLVWHIIQKDLARHRLPYALWIALLLGKLVLLAFGFSDRAADPEWFEQYAIGDGVLSVPAIEAATGVRRTRIELLVKVLGVDGAVERTPSGYCVTGRPWSYDHEKYAGIVAARRAEAELMRAYAMSRECLEVILRRALDDPVEPGERCGRCSACRGRR